MDSEITFQDRKPFNSLVEYHHKGGEVKAGMEVFCERNFRGPLEPATIISHQLGGVEMDITGYGKYSSRESQVLISRAGVIEPWPWTMLLIKK